MFRLFFFLAFALGVASAATISTTATCDGVTTVGTATAMCNDGRSFASAGVGFLTFPSSVFTVNVDAGPGIGLPGSAVASASASFSEDALFTVFGGTGSGFFLPCLSLESINGGSAEVSFAGVGAPSGCSPPFFGKQPFTFGVPQIVQITAEGSVPGASFREDTASASLNGIAFLDNSGNLLPNATYTLVDSVPEPSSWCLLSVGVIFVLVVRIRGMRFRGGFRRCDLPSLR